MRAKWMCVGVYAPTHTHLAIFIYLGLNGYEILMGVP
jgi:hypothetical protein